MVTGCNARLNDMILVAYPKSREHMMKLWQRYAKHRILAAGVLRSDTANCWMTHCGQSGENCTAYCLDCARRFGFIW